MSNQYISINGTNFNPSGVDDDTTKIGDSRRMGDGTLRYYHRANKGKWVIKWNNLRETFITTIKTLAFTNATLTFIDYDGNTFTVIVLPGSWKRSIAAEQMGNDGIKRYNIELSFEEV